MMALLQATSSSSLHDFEFDFQRILSTIPREGSVTKRKDLPLGSLVLLMKKKVQKGSEQIKSKFSIVCYIF